ncbi:hypothetical protein BCR37DRAFT_382629 [Protomyces lactucae-debilis]|uniref:Uncharacterized protein n=1 Tax=Protomyces lactucae-debilis TaxID=2754530 RepID=A0A1Y2F1G2_PROLT|nr:uncharacterized protein BCR37DRAFT_382629 [Protomyces lactucae-debilis]ORY77732.1 hypothetical protein BCR37DRAFT_382629 [Protomyces lactucae-debilis]
MKHFMFQKAKADTQLPAWASPIPQDECNDEAPPSGDDDNAGSRLVIMYELHRYLVTRVFEFADHTKFVVQYLVVTIQEHCVMRIPNPLAKHLRPIPSQQTNHPLSKEGTLPSTTLLKTFSPVERAAAIVIVVFAALMTLASLITIGIFVYRKLTGDEAKKGADGMLVKYGFNDAEKQECQRLMDASADEEEPEVAPAYESRAQQTVAVV